MVDSSQTQWSQLEMEEDLDQGAPKKQKHAFSDVWQYMRAVEGANCVCTCCETTMGVQYFKKVERIYKHFHMDKNHNRLPGSYKEECKLNPYKATLGSGSGPSSGKGFTPSMLSHLVPNLPRETQARFTKHLANWFYETGTAFSRVESKHLLLAVRVLRKETELPSRKALSGSMLSERFEEIRALVAERLKELDMLVCLVTDGS